MRKGKIIRLSHQVKQQHRMKEEKRTRIEAESGSMPPRQADEVYERMQSLFAEEFDQLRREVNTKFFMLSDQMSKVTIELYRL